MAGPSLLQVNLVVRDVAASIAFFRLLEVPMEATKHPDWAAHHAAAVLPNGTRLELDSLAFAQQWTPGLVGRGAIGGVVFLGVAAREDVDRLCARVASAGHRVQLPPEDAFWGARYAIVEDLDGHGIGLMSAIDPAKRRPPPPPPGG